MAAAATLQLASIPTNVFRAPPNHSYEANLTSATDVKVANAHIVHQNEAARLASICRQAFNTLNDEMPDFNHSKSYTADEILAMPFDTVRLPDELHGLPRRKSVRSQLAEAIATLLYPATHDQAVSPVIAYDAARVRVRAWIVLQRKYDIFAATKRNGHSFRGLTGGAAPGVRAPVWSSRILEQGPWDPSKHRISTAGTEAIPMPVAVADAADLAPFFDHLQRGGTHELDKSSTGSELGGGKGEPYYGVKGAEFRKGVVYEDGRMDLCKMVVGPNHIGNLMDSLRPNSFIRHFLLGNNIIGPVGAHEIAHFIQEFPDRMDTWYLAGNCIDATSFKILIDAMVKSDAVTNIWLKRNPLGPTAVADVYRLITETKNLRTLDLDQTELGDAGIAELFRRLACFSPVSAGRNKLPLRHLYLNGNGISLNAAVAIAAFLASPACDITSLYLSCNPLGDAGVRVIADGARKAPQLSRLSLQSVGMNTDGATALFEAIASHPNMRFLDVGQAYATLDLGQAWNYIEDASVPSLCKLLLTSRTLDYLKLGHCPITPPALRVADAAVLKSTLLYYSADSVLPDPELKTPAFKPAADKTMAEVHSVLAQNKKATQIAVSDHLKANVRARYGDHITWTRFIEEEKRWIANDKTDVRKIDSVYRNRDAGNARRRLQVLVKRWDEADGTLNRVMNANGPFCSMRIRKH
ncbi:Protein NLRC3 [Colletotrichum chlorophyti]|uniref:Protein NLRC3 n=1 Tax=Colletotrichum chlorophyti TaxID=708187 RepID=A0A1Q8S3T5_9PEZI|nr:Protein NLRC3 [Colletotrichum chlorophyti]